MWCQTDRAVSGLSIATTFVKIGSIDCKLWPIKNNYFPEKQKRNSKAELIRRIVELSEKNSLDLEFSDTKLKRMTKNQLQQILADQMEKIMQNEVAETVGANRGASQQVVAMHALRMMHDIAAKGFEVGGNKFANQYGYDISGFSENLKEPIVSEAVNQCLEEIALENADILEYVKSPYARLGLAWAGCLATCAKKLPRNNNIERNNKQNARRMEPRSVNV